MLGSSVVLYREVPLYLQSAWALQVVSNYVRMCLPPIYILLYVGDVDTTLCMDGNL